MYYIVSMTNRTVRVRSPPNGRTTRQTPSQLEVDYQRPGGAKYSTGILDKVLNQSNTGPEARTTRAISGTHTASAGGNRLIASKASNRLSSQPRRGFQLQSLSCPKEGWMPEASNKLKSLEPIYPKSHVCDFRMTSGSVVHLMQVH